MTLITRWQSKGEIKITTKNDQKNELAQREGTRGKKRKKLALTVNFKRVRQHSNSDQQQVTCVNIILIPIDRKIGFISPKIFRIKKNQHFNTCIHHIITSEKKMNFI